MGVAFLTFLCDTIVAQKCGKVNAYKYNDYQLLWSYHLMFTFNTYVELTEAKSEVSGEARTAVFTFGRFNPPTRGHEKLVNAVISEAKARNADAFIFTSHSHDPKKNPLEYSDKIHFMRLLFPSANIIDDQNTDGITQPIKNAFQVTGFLGSQGYTDLVLVAGSDRVPEYQKRFDRSHEFFDSFEVVSAGERDPDADGVSGLSGTKAREAAISGDIGKFRAATGWSGEVASQLMSATRKGLGIE